MYCPVGFYPLYPFYNIYSLPQTYYRFSYPAVNTKIFSQSVKSFSILMQQGSVLLSRLANPPFARKLMEAAQQGKKAQVEQLINTIGLKVPITTHYTPAGISLTLHSKASQLENCCSLTFVIKWGQ